MSVNWFNFLLLISEVCGSYSQKDFTHHSQTVSHIFSALTSSAGNSETRC